MGGQAQPEGEKLDHPRLGKTTVVEKGGRKLTRLSVSGGADKVEKWRWLINSIQEHRDKHLFVPLHISDPVFAQCFGKSQISAVYPFTESTLEILVKQRTDPFSEDEMAGLASSLIEVAADLREFVLEYSHIHPSNVLLSEGLDKAMVFCSFSMPEDSLGKTHWMQTGYFAPELLTLAESGQVIAKADEPAYIFSAGMTILHAASLADCQPLYDRTAFSIDWDKLQERLQSLREAGFYSASFLELLGNMLQKDPARRGSATVLYRKSMRDILAEMIDN